MKIQEFTDRFDENHLPYQILPLQNGVSILVSEYGGRIFGPFPDRNAESIYWANPVFRDRALFQEFLRRKEWNLGGDRWWIAPEIQYGFTDRNDPQKFRLQASMDPGEHTLEPGGAAGCRLIQPIELEAKVVATGVKKLTLEVATRPAADPLRSLKAAAELEEGVIYAGYEQQVTLTDRSPDKILSESWNVIQLCPGGQIVLPISPAYETADYGMLPVTPEWQTFHGNHLRLRITGDRVFKTGYQAAHTTGRLAYLAPLSDDTGYLLIRNFYNNPSSEYTEEPVSRPGHRGDATHIYHDDGRYGGFGELEVHGQTIGGSTGKVSSSDPFALWFYAGPLPKLRKIVFHLLGVNLDR